MQKTNHTTTENTNPEAISYVENRFQEFIIEYGRKVLYLILGLIILFLLMYRLSSGSKAGALTDYLNADKDFSSFQGSSLTEALAENGPLTNLKEILNRRPELNAKFDGLIAQELLIKEDPNNAGLFADKAFQRVSKDHLPYYIDYSRATLLVSQNRLQEALEKSKDLKQQMLSQTQEKLPQFGEVLYLFNLMRIAFLEQQVGTPQQELAAWKEVLNHKELIENSKRDQKEAQQLLQILTNHFQEGNASLNNYIKEREKKIEIK